MAGLGECREGLAWWVGGAEVVEVSCPWWKCRYCASNSAKTIPRLLSSFSLGTSTQFSREGQYETLWRIRMLEWRHCHNVDGRGAQAAGLQLAPARDFMIHVTSS